MKLLKTFLKEDLDFAVGYLPLSIFVGEEEKYIGFLEEIILKISEEHLNLQISRTEWHLGTFVIYLYGGREY